MILSVLKSGDITLPGPGKTRPSVSARPKRAHFTILRGPFGSIKVLAWPTVHRSDMVPQNSEGKACLGGKLPPSVA